MLRKYKLSKKEWQVQKALGLSFKTYDVNITGKSESWVRTVRAVSENTAIGKFIESMEHDNYYMDEVKHFTVKLINDDE